MTQLSAKKIPASRIARLSHLGRVVGHVAGQALYQSSKQLLQGQAPSKRSVLLTPSNLQKLSDHLAQMRGAAMKVGQLLSMESGELIPEELSPILAQLRNQGRSMPLAQLNRSLEQYWHKGWLEEFAYFSYQPIAAASIGQVHKARTQQGEFLAIKVQYPGVRESINSDVDNLASLLKWSGLIPKSVDFSVILSEAKLQLHEEANYVAESEFLNAYARALAGDHRFAVPELNQQWSNENILAMSFMEGEPIESVQTLTQAQRNAIMTHLFELFFKELFEWQMMQTDPNFANYLYQADTQKIVLLDFGATRWLSKDLSAGYSALIAAALEGDIKQITQALQDLNYLNESVTQAVLAIMVEIVMLACEPLRFEEDYDFAQSDLPSRIRDLGMRLSLEQNYWHSPPLEVLLIHRKIAGLFLLAVRLKARVNLRQVFQNIIHEPSSAKGEIDAEKPI